MQNEPQFWYDREPRPTPDRPRIWDDTVPNVHAGDAFNAAMLALADACFDDMTREPCDDRDDGFNKTSSISDLENSVSYLVSTDPFYDSVVYIGKGGWTHNVVVAHELPNFLGIVYKVGDTTTFSPGPYDESLGVPVTVHFKG